MANSWFPHDSTASTDSKLLRLRQKYGWEGYGMYFAILEWMWQSADARIPESDIEVLGTFLGKRKDFVRHLMDFCEDLGLFQKVSENYLSERLVSEKQKEIEKSAKARESAERRWKKSDAKAMRTQSVGNAPPTHPPTIQNAAASAAQSPTTKTTTLPDHLTGLAVYTIAKRFTFDNAEQIKAHIKRNLRASQSLSGYTPEQILRAFYYAYNESKSAGYEVKLETIGKKIHEHKDYEPEPQQMQAFRDILAEYEQHKDNVLSSTSYLLCEPTI